MIFPCDPSGSFSALIEKCQIATSHFGLENIEAIGQHRRGDHGANIDEESIDEANIGKFYVKVFLS